jgi:hypothetical protein
MIWLPDTDTVNYLIKRREPAWSTYVATLAKGDSFVLALVVHFEVTR